MALEWVSAAEAPIFVRKITEFTNTIRDLGPLGIREGLDLPTLIRKLKAARMAVLGIKIRTAFARQARQMKEDNTHGKLPDKGKLLTAFGEEMTLHETLLCLREKRQSITELAGLLNVPEEQVASVVNTLKKKKILADDLTVI